MMGLIMALLPLALKIIGKSMDNKEASAETQRKFLAFVESASKDFGSSASLKTSYDNQKARMDAMEAEAAKKEQGGTPT